VTHASKKEVFQESYQEKTSSKKESKEKQAKCLRILLRKK
tara:strand:+ start:115 stop:234 length:120 start_codon:yes stop_codon:yes gene_type:complete